MIVQIGLPILLLAALVVAYLASKTWGWGHVTLGLALFFSTLFFLVLAAETLRIHAVVRKQYNDNKARLAAVEAQDKAVVQGTSEGSIINQLRGKDLVIPDEVESIDGITELRHEMNLVTRVRGRVWRGVTPAGPPAAQTYAVKVRVPAPDPHGIAKGTIIYAFQEGSAPTKSQPQGASYIGEFEVTEVAGQELTLMPVLLWAATDAEVARLAAAVRGPWELYETMPVDRHEIFAGMTEEQLREIIDPQSVEEYIRHGTEATADDDEWHRVGIDADGNRLGPNDWDKAVTFRYERQLRDYSYLFHEYAQLRTELQTRIAARKLDIERLKASLASAQKLQAYREEEKRKLEHDLTGMKGDLAFIQKMQAQVELQVKNGKQALANFLAENNQLVSQLAEMQQAAADQINLISQPAIAP